MKINFVVNKKQVNLEIDPEMPLLWAIRDILDLKATKFGCGMALCGACTVHIDGQPIRSCSVPVSFAADKEVKTLEGLTENIEKPHPIHQAWLEENVPQCGYCQSGFMMAAANLIEQMPDLTEQDIKDNITNICRCGTQPRIIKAILKAAKLQKQAIK